MIPIKKDVTGYDIQVYAPVLIVKPSPFADNEAGQIRTYVTRDTYRQGAFCPSI